MNFRKSCVKVKVVFDRGKLYVGYVTFLMMVFLTFRNLSEYPALVFLKSPLWLVGTLVVAVLLIGFIGFLDLRVFRTYQDERRLYARIDPIMSRILEILEGLKK